MDAAASAAVRAALPTLRVPGGQDRVFKSECAFSFDTAESPGGLYTNLATHASVGAAFVALDRARTGAAVYLHTLARRVARPVPSEAAAAAAAPTKLAIGVAGGFNADGPAYDVVPEHAIVVFTRALAEGEPPGGAAALRLPHPSPASAELPMLVTAVADAVIAVRDTGVAEAAAATWEDVPFVSKYADGLVQQAAPAAVSPSPGDWACADCDKRDNLWLNLGDGHIGCGRKNWDGRCARVVPRGAAARCESATSSPGPSPTPPLPHAPPTLSPAPPPPPPTLPPLAPAPCAPRPAAAGTATRSRTTRRRAASFRCA